MYISELINELKEQGYDQIHAEARLCQDIVMQAISKSSLSRNVTIKGGVVMRSISHDTRRATRDLDIDFIRYSLQDDAIEQFMEKINCLESVQIIRIGKIEELKQQDYHGKRVHIKITDELGYEVISKIDLGVHKNLAIEQEEFCFDICYSEDGASLLINSKEQMFTEKLRSLLKFGSFSTRYKDVFDIYYLSQFVNKKRLMACFQQYVFDDAGMKENTMKDVIRRVNKTFQNRNYKNKILATDTNWLEMNITEVLSEIERFLVKMCEEVA